MQGTMHDDLEAVKEEDYVHSGVSNLTVDAVRLLDSRPIDRNSDKAELASPKIIDQRKGNELNAHNSKWWWLHRLQAWSRKVVQHPV